MYGNGKLRRRDAALAATALITQRYSYKGTEGCPADELRLDHDEDKELYLTHEDATGMQSNAPVANRCMRYKTAV